MAEALKQTVTQHNGNRASEYDGKSMLNFEIPACNPDAPYLSDKGIVYVTFSTDYGNWKLSIPDGGHELMERFNSIPSRFPVRISGKLNRRVFIDAEKKTENITYTCYDFKMVSLK